MATTLQSPLEPLALNYRSYGLFLEVNSIWAWIAVLTAALSFWRIRASSSPPLRGTSNHTATKSPSSLPEDNFGKGEEVKIIPLSAAVSGGGLPEDNCGKGEEVKIIPSSAAVSSGDQKVEGSRKTKFRLYYKENDFRRENDEDGEAEAEDTGITAEAVVKRKVGRFCDDWEKMMALRMGDLGWYRWVDTAALDGSVVRLWDAPPRTMAVRV